MIINAKQEFLSEVYGHELLASQIVFGSFFRNHERKFLLLPVGFTSNQYDSFLLELDFDYDNSFGNQLIMGCIWYKDGTWSERDCAEDEWWEYKSCPPLPNQYLQRSIEL